MPDPGLIPSFAGPPRDGGLTTHGVAMGVRPGILAVGESGRNAVTQLNEIIAKCGRVLYTAPAMVTTLTGPSETQRFRFRTGPAKTLIAMRMLLQSATTKGNGANDPSCYWTVGGVAQPTIRYPRRETSLALDDLTEVTQLWSLDADTAYNAVLTVADKIAVAGATAWEVPRKSLNLATDIGARRSYFADGASILDLGLDDMYEALEDVWKLGGTNWWNWTTVSATGQTVTGGPALKNIWDGTSTAYSATAPGAWCWPQYHGSLDSDNIPVELWAVMKASAGIGTARFVDSSGTIGADLETTSASFVVVTQTTTWNASASAEKKVDVLGRCSGGGTVEIAACGMLTYEA